MIYDPSETQNYDEPTTCTFLVTTDVALVVDRFDLGAGDRLRVANVPFRGGNGPDGVVVEAGRRIRFIAQDKQYASSSEDTGKGFKICADSPPADPFFKLEKRVGEDAACLTSDLGRCILSDAHPDQDYGSSFRCIWRIMRDFLMYSHDFELGENDRVRIKDLKFVGQQGPDGLSATAGSKVKFKVDERERTSADDEYGNGFKICSYPEE